MQIQPSQIAPEQTKAYNVFQNKKPSSFYLKSPVPALTEFLEGGLHTGMITQIYGQSGAGKTQMAMLFSIQAIYQNMIVGYLATEKQLHWGRFTELAYGQMNESEFDQNQSFFKYKKNLDDFEIQMNFIETIFKEIEQSKKGGLLVVDNIYSLITSSFVYFKIESSYQKARKQAEIINKIRRLAKITNSCVLFLNKVSDVIEKKRSSVGGRSTIPALGTSWELNLDESLQMKKSSRGDVKELKVIHSPKCARGKILYRIQKSGFSFLTQEGVELE